MCLVWVMLVRSPTTTDSAAGSLFRVSSARCWLRACNTTLWPCPTKSCAAIRPKPSADPVMKIRAINTCFSRKSRTIVSLLKLMFRALFQRSQPKIVASVHNVRLLLAKLDRSGPLHNFFRHDVAPFVRPQEKERVIGMHPSTIAKPADAAVRNELMHPALNVDPEGVPREPRSFVELSIRAVQQLHIVGVRIPLRPPLSVDNAGEDLLARCMNDNLVVREQIGLLRVKTIRPMYLPGALCSISIGSKGSVDLFRFHRLSLPHSNGADCHHNDDALHHFSLKFFK